MPKRCATANISKINTPTTATTTHIHKKTANQQCCAQFGSRLSMGLKHVDCRPICPAHKTHAQTKHGDGRASSSCRTLVAPRLAQSARICHARIIIMKTRGDGGGCYAKSISASCCVFAAACLKNAYVIFQAFRAGTSRTAHSTAHQKQGKTTY